MVNRNILHYNQPNNKEDGLNGSSSVIILDTKHYNSLMSILMSLKFMSYRN